MLLLGELNCEGFDLNSIGMQDGNLKVFNSTADKGSFDSFDI